jgi:hypothetical protein
MATNSARLIARHPLNNGLTLEFWDHSRPVAGDRWYVHLETRICIPLRTDTLPPELKTHSDQVRGALGGEIIFSQQEARNFIAASEAPKTLQDMQDRILAMVPGYFGHADFAAGFIRRKYAEWQERQ